MSIEEYPMIFQIYRSENTAPFPVYPVSQWEDHKCIPERVHTPLEKLLLSRKRFIFFLPLFGGMGVANTASQMGVHFCYHCPPRKHKT